MSAPIFFFFAINQTVVKIYPSKPKKLNLTVVFKETSGISKDSKLCLLGTTNVCTEFLDAEDVKIFYWISEYFDLFLVLKEKIMGSPKSLGNHSLSTMDSCTKCHDNPPSSCWDISPETKNVNVLVALEKMSQGHKSYYSPSSGDHAYLHKILWQSIQLLRNLTPTDRLAD